MRSFLLAAAIFAILASIAAANELQIATFVADVTPPVGSPLAYDPTREVETPLTARGIVLLGSGKPIVLCSVDWIGIANGGRTAWRTELAEAVGTSIDRVALHTVHQHDAPECDLTVESLLAEQGQGGKRFDNAFARRAMGGVVEEIKKVIKSPETVTHIGVGKGEVKMLASNRRVIGEDGKIKYWRGSTTGNPKARAEPEGLIDPDVRSISFFNGDKPIVVLCYYATHPMSYYRTGKANADFVGLAREAREKELGVTHIYFTGAAGNVAAGKYNDGSRKNRQIFADRLAAGMALAWKDTQKHEVTADDVRWRTKGVKLPPSAHLNEEAASTILGDDTKTFAERFQAARELAWLKRCREGEPIDLSCLHIGPASIVHMCGELFIEYQLAAQKMQPDRFVAMAAYGEYAMGYIGTAEAYPQGGYEVGRRASRTAPEVEDVLIQSIRELLRND